MKVAKIINFTWIRYSRSDKVLKFISHLIQNKVYKHYFRLFLKNYVYSLMKYVFIYIQLQYGTRAGKRSQDTGEAVMYRFSDMLTYVAHISTSNSNKSVNKSMFSSHTLTSSPVFQ
jgi:hypothetical protein